MNDKRKQSDKQKQPPKAQFHTRKEMKAKKPDLGNQLSSPPKSEAPPKLKLPERSPQIDTKKIALPLKAPPEVKQDNGQTDVSGRSQKSNQETLNPKDTTTPIKVPESLSSKVKNEARQRKMSPAIKLPSHEQASTENVVPSQSSTHALNKFYHKDTTTRIHVTDNTPSATKDTNQMELPSAVPTPSAQKQQAKKNVTPSLQPANTPKKSDPKDVTMHIEMTEDTPPHALKNARQEKVSSPEAAIAPMPSNPKDATLRIHTAEAHPPAITKGACGEEEPSATDPKDQERQTESKLSYKHAEQQIKESLEEAYYKGTKPAAHPMKTEEALHSEIQDPSYGSSQFAEIGQDQKRQTTPIDLGEVMSKTKPVRISPSYSEATHASPPGRSKTIRIRRPDGTKAAASMTIARPQHKLSDLKTSRAASEEIGIIFTALAGLTVGISAILIYILMEQMSSLLF